MRAVSAIALILPLVLLAREAVPEEAGPPKTETEETVKAAAPETERVAAPSGGEKRESFGKLENVCVSDQKLIEDLRAAEKRGEETRLALAAKEAELLARETALNEQMRKLDELKSEIAGLSAERDAKAEERVSKLVQTVEKMSPKAAAALIEKLDEKLAVSTIGRVETARLAKIMNVLSADTASRLSESLATGRISKARNPSSAKPEGKGTSG